MILINIEIFFSVFLDLIRMWTVLRIVEEVLKFGVRKGRFFFAVSYGWVNEWVIDDFIAEIIYG